MTERLIFAGSSHCINFEVPIMIGMTKFFLVAGWLALALVAFVTLAPIYDRPTVGPVQLEHFAAFFGLGLVFVLSYPSRTLLVILVVVGGAAALEALQLLTPDRHGRLIDALVKMVGGLCGILFSTLVGVVIAQAKTKIAPLG